MKNIVVALAVGCIASVVGAAGFDGKSLSTNDWFDARFTALTVDTPIAQGDTLGITSGAGSWTAVPATGTAVIAADADAGGEATLLAISAPDEELTFTPAALAATSGLETVSAEIKADAIDELPALGADVQAAFTVYLDGNGVLSAQGWTAAGWTNLASAAADSLTNAWFTLYADFAKEGGVRYVRYSVKPASGALAVLADADGTTWFQAGRNADVVSSMSFSGIGSVRSFSGDELEVVVQGVATYNGVGYETFEAAIAAGVADGWANGNVVMLSDAEWFPTATGAYNVDVNSNTLTVKGASGSWSGTTYTVDKLYYIWTGGATGDWWTASNWTPSPSKWSNGDYVMFTNDVSVLYNNNTDRNNTYYYHYTYADGCTVTVSSKTGDGTYYRMVPNSMIAQNGGKWIFDNVNIAQRGANLVMDSSFGFAAGSSNIVYSGNNSKDVTISCDLVGDFVIDAQGGAAFNVTGDISAFTGKLISNETKANRGIVFGAGSSDTSMSGSSDASFTVNEGAYMYFNVANSVQFQIGELLGNGTICGDNRNAAGESFRLYIGGKNTDFEANANVNRVSSGSQALDVSKVGTGAMAYNLNGVRNLYVDAGSVVVTNSSRLPSTGIAFCGGKAKDAASTVMADISSKIKDSTSAIDIDIANNAMFATALPNSNTGGLVKRGSGTLTLSAVPAYTGATVLKGGRLVVPQGTTIAELSCEGGMISVPLDGSEDETDVLTIETLADGTELEDLEEALSSNVGTFTVVVGESGYTVKATRSALTFTWSDASGDHTYENASNWKVGDETAAAAPVSVDSVVFPADGAPWTVTLAGSKTVVKATFNGNTTLSADSGDSTRYLITSLTDGAGTICMGGYFGLRTPGSTEAFWNNNVDVAADTRNYFYLDQASATFNGNLTGSGYIQLYDYKQSHNFYMNGTNTAFAGEFEVKIQSGATRDYCVFASTNALSALASWKLVGFYDSDTTLVTNFPEDGEYEFGALNGSVNLGGKRRTMTFVIGARNEDCSFGGRMGRGHGSGSSGDQNYYNHIRKVGTAALTYTGTNLGNVEIQSGTYVVGSAGAYPNQTYLKGAMSFTGETAMLAVTGTTTVVEETVFVDPSESIKYSTYPICFSNDVGEVHTWSTALADSNVGGLTKKGAGTLTLSEKPLYRGLTTVEEGTLVVPEGTEVTVNALYANNVPENATVVGYGYPAETTIEAPTVSGSVSYDAPLDCSGLVAIDASGIELTSGVPYEIAAATQITKWRHQTPIELTLPDGVDPSKWKLSVRTIGGKRCLCLADFDMGSMLILH